MWRDGDVALARVRSFVEARLPRAPMLLRTFRPTHLGQGTPAWIDAPRFDITQHVVLAPADRSLTDENDFLRRDSGSYSANAVSARMDSSCAPRFR
jgi:hypothetical protein